MIHPSQSRVYTQATFNDNAWHHVVGVWNGTDGVATNPSQLKIYVDGIEVSTTAVADSGPIAPLAGNPAGSLMAGSGYYQSGKQLIGSIDEIAHYNYTALSPDQIMKHYRLGKFGIDMADISAQSVIRHPGFGAHSFSSDALIVNPFRSQHARDNTVHYDLDLDTFILLAQALEIYPAGDDLHTVLTGILGRLDYLEGRSNDFPPDRWFDADAVLFKSDIFGHLTIDAIRHREAEATALIDATLNPPDGAFDASAILLESIFGSLAMDAVNLRATESTVLVDAITKRTYAVDSVSDAVILRTQEALFHLDARLFNGYVEETIVVDALVRKAIETTMTIDSIVRQTILSSASVNVVIARTQAGSSTADAVLSAIGVAPDEDSFMYLDGNNSHTAPMNIDPMPYIYFGS